MTLSTIVLVMGQTTAIFAYDFAVRIGLQESVEKVSAFGVEMNRAFGVGDTVAYIPLMILSVIGLLARKRWALFTTTAAMGISIYWTVTLGIMMVFLKGVPGYTLMPGVEYWIFMGAHTLFGVWGILYLVFRGEEEILV